MEWSCVNLVCKVHDKVDTGVAEGASVGRTIQHRRMNVGKEMKKRMEEVSDVWHSMIPGREIQYGIGLVNGKKKKRKKTFLFNSVRH